MSDPDGRFRLEHLAPGKYMVQATLESVRPRPSGGLQPIETVLAPEGFEFPWALEVFEGRTTHHDVDLGAMEVGRLRGRLRVDGRGHRFASVRLVPGDRDWAWDGTGVEETTLREDGSFSFDDHRTGPAWLVFSVNGPPLGGTRIVRPIRIERGENTVEVELDSGAIGGRCPIVAGGLALLTEFDDGAFAVMYVDGGAGYLECPSVPAGGTTRLVQGIRGDPRDWRTVLDVVVEAGTWTELE